MRDLRKDLDLAIALFDKSGKPTPLTHASSDLVTAAAAAMPYLDISAVIRPYREAAAASSGSEAATSAATPAEGS